MSEEPFVFFTSIKLQLALSLSLSLSLQVHHIDLLKPTSSSLRFYSFELSSTPLSELILTSRHHQPPIPFHQHHSLCINQAAHHVPQRRHHDSQPRALLLLPLLGSPRRGVERLHLRRLQVRRGRDWGREVGVDVSGARRQQLARHGLRVVYLYFLVGR